MTIKDVYIIYQDDRLKLPIYVADTLVEMAKITGINLKMLSRALNDNKSFLNNLRVEKVDITEPEDKYNENTYKKFCKKHNLSVGSFSSHKMFAKECYGILE